MYEKATKDKKTESNQKHEVDGLTGDHEEFLKDLSGYLHRLNNAKNEAEIDNECGILEDEEKGPRHNPKVSWRVMPPILTERYESPQ